MHKTRDERFVDIKITSVPLRPLLATAEEKIVLHCRRC
jgi:hypothetical protein